MRTLVTGADGFVGSWLIPKLIEEGHDVVAGLLPTASLETQEHRRKRLSNVEALTLDLRDSASVRTVASGSWEAVVHLAAAASGAEAQKHPEVAWEVNVLGTARLVNALADSCASGGGPLFLYVSSGEVYGSGEPGPRSEVDQTQPATAYAASKLAAEVAALAAFRAHGLRTVVARPFPHTGVGQDERFVVPAFTKRIVSAKKSGESEIQVGNLDPVRDFLHVSDVVEAYIRLLRDGHPGEVYNISSGIPVAVGDLFQMIAKAADHAVEPKVSEKFTRKVDVPYLVGDSTKLTNHTGWHPKISLEQAVREVVDAETD